MSTNIERIGVGAIESEDVNDDITFAKYAEEQGMTSFWYAESRLIRDAFTILGGAAQVTDEITLGTGIVPMWTRNVALMAQTWSTLEEMAGSRVKCGLGAWWEPLASKVGVDRNDPNPLRAMWEYTTVLRQMLDLENVTYEGEYLSVEDIELDPIRADPEPRNVPIYIGATGLQMNKMAGELVGKGVLDGVVFNALVPPEHDERCIEQLKEGVEKHGGDISDVDRPGAISLSMDEDADKAIDMARGVCTQYIGQQPHITQHSGISEDLADDIIDELGGWPASMEDVERASQLLPDSAVLDMVVAGTPEDCIEQVEEYIEAGRTEPILTPITDNKHEVVDVFSEVL